MITYHYILKWEGGVKRGNPILFLPDQAANPGRMLCYVHTGQHSEADISYYLKCRNPDTSHPHVVEACIDLVNEYAAKMEEGETFKRVFKDTARFRKERIPADLTANSDY